MATARKTFRFVVNPTAGVAANTTLAVGTNVMQAARPSGFSAGGWGSTMFNQYSGGAFVPGWGAAGCFAMAGHGGHNANSNNSADASIFDFNDDTWKYLPNTNGVTHSPYTFNEGDLDGTSNEALAGSGGACPPPSHTYRLHTGVGSALILPQIQYGLQSGNGGARAWQCALNHGSNTCTWSRLTSNNARDIRGQASGADYLHSLYDPLRGRIWFFSPLFAQENVVATFRPGIDSAFVGASYSGLSGTSMQQNGSIRGDMVLDTVRDCIWLFGANGQLYRMNLADPPTALTWVTQTSTGLATNGIAGTGASAYKLRWHLYPTADGGDGCFYTHAHAGQSILKKFDPASRVFSLVTIANGPTLPTWDTSNPGHYSRFFYVPYRRCFAWIPGSNASVYLVRP